MYDRNDLIRRLKIRLGRPTSDNAFTVTTADDVYDDQLGEAQDHLMKQIALFCPDAIISVPTLLTSADGGYTYTFGTDTDGAAVFAIGHFQLFESKDNIPGYPLIEGVDFTVEGTKVRFGIANVPRSFADGPYAQSASPSNVISSSVEPVIPKIARLALLSEAEVRCWRVLGMDTSGAEQEAERDWMALLGVIRTQSASKNAPPLARRSRYSRYR